MIVFPLLWTDQLTSLLNFILNGKMLHVLTYFSSYCFRCDQCVSFASEFVLVSEAFMEADIKLVAIDITEDDALRNQFDIKGFPTMKYFAEGGDFNNPVNYDGGGSALDMAE